MTKTSSHDKTADLDRRRVLRRLFRVNWSETFSAQDLYLCVQEPDQVAAKAVSSNGLVLPSWGDKRPPSLEPDRP